MRRFMLSAILVSLSSPLYAQDEAAPEQTEASQIDQQAGQLEGELGKFKDTSPEAAEVMVKLTDLYHSAGRVFGLARVAQKFAAAHPSHPAHKDVMLKLIDGLEALSRNEDLESALRQFLARYPDEEVCAALEIRLADTMEQTTDRKRLAEACHAVWNRQGPNEVGRKYGARAVETYSAVGGASIIRGVELASDMVDKLPADSFAWFVGWRGFYDAYRISKWAESNVLGNKLIDKNIAPDPEALRALHAQMSYNYERLGQYANAVESLKKVRAIRDDQRSHYDLVRVMHSAAAKAAEMEPFVNDYVAKYPQRADRHHLTSYLAAAFFRDQNPARALSILGTLIADDAITNSNAQTFVQNNGTEPAQLADTEKKMVAAVQKNTKDGAYLRYILAFYLYRDRLKDDEKVRSTLRDLIDKSPSNNSYSSTAISWLLSNATDEAMFKAEVARCIGSRKAFIHLTAYRTYLESWAKSNRKSKDETVKQRVAFVQAEVEKASTDPLVALSLQQAFGYDRAQAVVRDQLAAPNMAANLSDDYFRTLMYNQAYYYRHYSPAAQRKNCVDYYGRLAQKFPQDFDYAVNYLQVATDYAPKEVQKEAALHLLKLAPENAQADHWRRLLLAADRNADAELVKQIHAWMVKAQEIGRDPTYAGSIGDTLKKYELEDEALAHWNFYLTYQRDHSESRECTSRLLTYKKPEERIPFLQEQFKHTTSLHGRYAMWMAQDYFTARDFDNFEKVLRETRARQNERPYQGWDFDDSTPATWAYQIQANEEATDEQKVQVLSVIRDLDLARGSSVARLLLLNRPTELTRMQQLLEYQKVTRLTGDQYYHWDVILPFARAASGRKDHVVAATIATGMLSNIASVDEGRKKAVRDLVTQSYARMGSVGLTIDEDSPIAPLLQAAMYLRLGDANLAFDTYAENVPLFDEHRNELPVDLIEFVCERLSAAGGDENFDHVEEILRGWMVKNSENAQIDDITKARIQLMLGKNYFKAQRFDIARSEFTTTMNRYSETPQAIEAEFGIGETFMAQKVFDQAEQVFEKLARSTVADIVVRAEFLRGVLSFRRGDRDEARDIFRGVLERVPNVSLANQALFNLAEVYGAEERYMDQLNLLRTVGRLGRHSKRRHVPGTPLSVVVHDSDLGISRGHNKIPVIVTTEPGGDKELVYLTGAGAGKGLFRVDLNTRLGSAVADDKVLQLTGNDIIHCDYPDQFKAEFKNVPLSDVEIQVAANAKFQVSSSKIEEEKKLSFSELLAQESDEDEDADQRVSQDRPVNQIKPGNPVYLRVQDFDRDLSDEIDTVVVKLAADSGDQVQVSLTETGAHTGIFEATAATAELPAGAIASDTAIEHNPLMAIDKDATTFWMSRPDGATPKDLTIDMKDLRKVSRIKLSTPDATRNAPVRGDILGSHDGEFWFRIASHPPRPKANAVKGKPGRMSMRAYSGNYTRYTTWDQVVSLSQSDTLLDEQEEAEGLHWVRDADSEEAATAYAVIWNGKLVQPREGAARIRVVGTVTGLSLNGEMEIPIGRGTQTVDLWLDQGLHDLTIFSASSNGQQPVGATWARADLNNENVVLAPFRSADFDLDQPAAQLALSGTFSGAQPVELGAATARINRATETFGPDQTGVISNWNTLDDWVEWEFEAATPGAYEVWFNYAHQGNGGQFLMEFGRQTVTSTVPNTGGNKKFFIERVGTLLIEAAGRHSVAVKPVDIQGGSLMNLRGVTLKPAAGGNVIALDDVWDVRFRPMELRHVKFVVHEYRGEAVAINHVEIGGPQRGQLYIPTQTDVLSLANNQTLEIAAGDMVKATYTDDHTQSESGGSQLLTESLTATYNNGFVAPIAYDFVRSGGGAVTTARKELMRIDPGERIVVEITDFDRDQTNERDLLRFQVMVNDGEPVSLTATETEEYSGIFTKEVDTTSEVEDGKLTVKQGDRVYIRYIDGENTFPGHAVPREAVVYVNEPSEGRVRILESRVIPPPMDSNARPQTVYLPPDPDTEISGVAFEAPLTVEVVDPDAAKDSRSTVTVELLTTDGSTVEVVCEISDAFAEQAPVGQTNWALQEGRFIGQVILQLGGKDTASIVPLTADMPRNLIGEVKMEEEGGGGAGFGNNLITRVLSLTGKDVVAANYDDALRPGGKAEKLAARGRLITNGKLVITDREYEKPVDRLHVGEKIYLLVTDADQDSSDERDTISVEITSEFGERETVDLAETLAHSGVFTGSFTLKAVSEPDQDNLVPDDPVIESYFGDKLKCRYQDKAAGTESGEAESSVEVPVVVGTDGLVAAFTKAFNDETLAVETKFRIAESYFELFKSHKELGRTDEQTSDLEAGRRVLQEVMEDYPDPKYAPRIAYLLGQFAQELEQWDEAIKSYELIIRQFAEHPLAADAQYKLAQSYEEAGDFDEALEQYVTLAATYPKSPLISSVMIRISDYFYKKEQFIVAAQVGKKFLEKFEGNEHASRMAFRTGQCFYKAEQYATAGESFDEFVKTFPDDQLTSDAMFWSGESYRLGNNNREAFRRYNRCRWDYPASEAAKYARGRLALPEMLQQFEQDINSVDNDN